MDAVLKMVLDNVLSPAWADRNFLALVFMCWQLRSQKITFDLKIKNIEKVSDKAEKKSDEAIKAVGEIKPKVDDMHDWFKSLSDDKFKGIQGIVNGKEESTEA